MVADALVPLPGRICHRFSGSAHRRHSSHRVRVSWRSGRLGIGFGTQNLFKKLVSGILRTLKRPFRLDNVIEVDEVPDSVSDIGVSATIVRAFDGKDVVIPNRDLLEIQRSTGPFLTI